MELADFHDTEIDAMLEHFGIKGMKWGIRKSESKTGISRVRGAMIDRNDRYIARLQKAHKGKGGGGLIRDRIEMRLAKIEMGNSAVKRHMNLQIAEMRDQNKRLKTGKVTVRDKLDMLMTTTPAALILSNRPK